MFTKIDDSKKITCCLCKEIKSGDFPDEYYQHYPIRQRVCYETEKFVVLPSISPIATGHVIICPKEHLTSMVLLPQNLKAELCGIVGEIYWYFRKLLGPVYIFEHGVSGESETACGINHAHIHIVPLSENSVIRINERVCREFCTQSVDSLYTFLKEEKEKGTYLLYGHDINKMNVVFDQDIPSQFMRKHISQIIGRREWDWKKFYGWEDFSRTVSAFAGFNGNLQAGFQ